MSIDFNPQGITRWIGLADVAPTPGNELLGVAKGAVVAVVADAESSASFSRIVSAGFADRGFELLSLEDVEPLSKRPSRHEIPIELKNAISAISADAPLAVGTFHSYEK